MPECYADTLLIETIVPSKKGYNHKHSCFQVEKAMISGKLKDSFAVGIIDNDKKSINYLTQLEKIDAVNDNLVLWKHPTKPQFIIQICPALEQWVLNICKEEKIEIKYDLEKLKKITKSMSSLDNIGLKELFNTIKDKDNNESVRKLKGWIKLLCTENYQVDLNELKNV